MNFFPADLVSDGEQMVASAPSLRIRFGGEQANRLRNASGRSVVVGIRPEDIGYGQASGDTNGAARVDVGVDVVEELGSEKLVYLLLNDKSVVARLGADVAVRPGDRAEMVLRQDKLHVFGASTEQKLV